MKNLIWCEKYRPKRVDDLVLGEDILRLVKKIVDTDTIPSFTLHGHTGTGKSSIVNVIKESLDVEYLGINASESRGIDTIRDIIIPFCEKTSFNKHKLIDLREAEELTPVAQASLKDIIEENSSDTSFILTTNNYHKILPEILGRCKLYKMTPPSKQSVAIKLNRIAKNEGVTIDNKGLVYLVNSYFPDIRSMVMDLQNNTVDGEYIISKDSNLNSSIYEKIIEILSSCKSRNDVILKYKEVRILVNKLNNSEIDTFYTYLFNNITKLISNNDIEQYIAYSFHISDYMYKSSIVVDKSVNLSALLLYILKYKHYGI